MARPQTATPERILGAALTRFSRYGFKRTSMEDIAAEAGVSRAALYLQFRNKEEIFRSLASALQTEALGRVQETVRAGGPFHAMLQAAFEARSLRFIAIANDSPHGNELLDETSRLCGDLAAATQRRFESVLAELFRAAGRRGEIDLAAVDLTAPAAAELMCRAVAGLKGPGVTPELYRRRLASLLRVFIAGITPRGATRGAASSRPARARRRR
jgi:TetR/AcrR family transcriptional regulator, mexJK operon transcriptional repressor